MIVIFSKDCSFIVSFNLIVFRSHQKTNWQKRKKKKNGRWPSIVEKTPARTRINTLHLCETHSVSIFNFLHLYLLMNSMALSDVCVYGCSPLSCVCVCVYLYMCVSVCAYIYVRMYLPTPGFTRMWHEVNSKWCLTSCNLGFSFS